MDDFSREDITQVLNSQLNPLAISPEAKQNIIPTLLGITKLAKVQLQQGYYHHLGWILNLWRVQEALIKCTNMSCNCPSKLQASQAQATPQEEDEHINAANTKEDKNPSTKELVAAIKELEDDDKDWLI
ncbi:hypothetical protein EI94DRAFT_1799206 [Lactarius quietus]|nr:hypothetical protein EI94DRAFT_1799206 [Lactarius quietus]